MVNDKIIIAIDGHSSCGKSTFAKAIATMLGYVFIDTGAMYRAVTLWAMHQGILDKPEQIAERLEQVNVTFRFNSAIERSEIFLNDINVDNDIRSMNVSDHVSAVAQIPAVRTKLVALQQQMGKDGGIVMDGRDIGSVVFPDAQLKIYMTATVDVRAQRRYDELTAKGEKVSLEEIARNVAARDHADQNRAESPLIKAKDAIVLDNSTMTISQQMEWVRNILTDKGVI